MMKFMGACNDAKADLDHCFRAEKKAKQKKNLNEARRRKERAAARTK
jgi:hypothetical protein